MTAEVKLKVKTVSVAGDKIDFLSLFTSISLNYRL